MRPRAGSACRAQPCISTARARRGRAARWGTSPGCGPPGASAAFAHRRRLRRAGGYADASVTPIPSLRTSDSLQILDQVLLVRLAEVQLQSLVVVIDDVQQRCKSSIVVEAAFLMCPQSCERRRAILMRRRTIGLE